MDNLKWFNDFNKSMQPLLKNMGAIDAMMKSTNAIHANASITNPINSIIKMAAPYSMSNLGALNNLSHYSGMLTSHPNWGLTNNLRNIGVLAAAGLNRNVFNTISGSDYSRLGVPNVLNSITKNTGLLNVLAQQNSLDSFRSQFAIYKQVAASVAGIVQNPIFPSFNSLSQQKSLLSQISTRSNPNWTSATKFSPSAAFFATGITFTNLISAYPDIADSDIESVNDAIKANKELENYLSESISKGVSISSSDINEDEKVKKLDEFFYEFFYRATKHFGLSKQKTFIIAGIIYAVFWMLPKKPIENLVWGDSSMEMKEITKETLLKTQENSMAINVMSSQMEKLSNGYNNPNLTYGKTNKNSIIRSRNDYNSDSLGQLNANTQVLIVHEGKKWYKIIISTAPVETYGFIWRNNVTVE